MKKTNGRWLVVVLLFVATTINYMDRAILGIAGPSMMKDLSLSAVEFGILGSAFFWSYALMQIPVGVIVDKLGARLTYSIAIVWWSLCTVFTGMGRSLGGLIGIRVLMGIGEAPAFPTNTRVISDWLPSHFNERLKAPRGFRRPVPACHREWKTDTGKANFMGYETLVADPDTPESGPDVLRLMTLRSDDQFNTTIYSLDDRFRGVYGTRRVLLVNARDMESLELAEGTIVTARTAVDDGHLREVAGLRITPYDIPLGCVGGYFPECNPLVPLAHHAEQSMVPAAKAIPIRLRVTAEATQA